ncbi:hypothetical protein F5146DRAFT_1222226 [Armillaria mellea]|nr:hypothetical protein F5146DRAFT_1222226 [Armillaria mellea]
MSWHKQCSHYGSHESDSIPSQILPPHQDVFECLRSGKSTLDVDSSSIIEDISLLQNTLTDLDNDLNHLDSVDVLAFRACKERAEIVKIIEAKQSLLSPIRRLNRDVLLTIFSYTTEGTNNSLCMKNGPWTLLHTCHWWRLVVSSSPVLWSTLYLHVPRRATFPSHALDIVKLQLRLSQNSPLKLTMDMNFDFKQDDAIINEVMSHSNRWCEVSFTGTRRQLWKILGNSPGYSQLRRLVISTPYKSLGSTDPESINAPKLTSLGFHGGGRILTSLEFHAFISAATILEKLGVRSIDRAAYPNNPPLIPVTLPRLRQLSYLDISGTCPNYLISPALRVLSVMQQVDDITAVAELYNRSHFSLEKLYLCHNFRFSAVARFIETDALRSLVYLHVEVDDSAASDWITALTVTPSFCIFPNLSELTMGNSVTYLCESLSTPDNAQRYLAMVRSRLPKANGAATHHYLQSYLKKIALCVWHPQEAEDIYVSAFKAFRAGGLDANFHYSDGEIGSYWNLGSRLCTEIAGSVPSIRRRS